MASRILIADDYEDNRELLRLLLVTAEYEVFEACDGQECLKLAQELLPDLVMIDLSMPKLDGWEVFQALKANQLTSNIPCIAVTAYAEINRKRALNTGFDGYLPKPFRTVDLLTIVSGLLTADTMKANVTGTALQDRQVTNSRVQRALKKECRLTMGVAKLTDLNTILPQSKYARIERERRYLLQDLPEGLTRASPHLQITDNYLTGTRLRLRKVRDPQTNKWTVKFTQKFAPQPDDLSRTVITNTYLNAAEYELLSVFEANEIRKNRYPFEFAGHQFAVDMFLGDLLGLLLAEVSFETDAALNDFALPEFALADVTNNEIFSGGRLCYLSFADIREEVERLGLF